MNTTSLWPSHCKGTMYMPHYSLNGFLSKPGSLIKSFLFLVILLISSSCLQAQNTLKVLVRNEDSKEPLAGASVVCPLLKKGSVSDSTGLVILKDLPDGPLEIEISFVGFTLQKKKVNLPFTKNTLVVELESATDEDNPDVVVTATRTDRSVRNTPTRVEVIAGGEISENTSMRPGEIRMLLNESTGIMTQPTSAVSGTANLRIQELDGRYTQILRDGFPLYSGLSEGLSLVQIAPLDLKQVEIIKGFSSTLFGGGAIAGLINLVSKVPTDKRELNFLVNGTSTGGGDLSGFYAEKFGKLGITLFTSRNSSKAYDPDESGLSAIPKFRRYTITPRLFYYGKKTQANVGVSYISENRLGGSMDFIENSATGYFEQNNSKRFTTQFSLTHLTGEHSALTFKNSYNHFNRNLSIPTYNFDGLQQSSFSELSWNHSGAISTWVLGTNLYTDDFKETKRSTDPLRNYRYTTYGAFVQNTWSPSELISVESGIRGDYTKPYGFALLPRVSLLFHLSEELTSRIGGGLGYKLPTIFTEESEERQFQGILPINEQQTVYERSSGANLDFTYKTTIDELKLTVNPLLFYTRINHPLVLGLDANGKEVSSNANGYTDSKGLDVSARMMLNHFTFFTGYSYTVAQNHFNGVKAWYPLAPHDRLHFDLVYEIEDQLRIAFESYYTGKQQLSDGTLGNPYWLLGALVEKSWKHFSVFLNGEDLNNVRQTRWEPVYTGSINNPSFRDVYTPLEGRSINAGIKIKL